MLWFFQVFCDHPDSISDSENPAVSLCLWLMGFSSALSFPLVHFYMHLISPYVIVKISFCSIWFILFWFLALTVFECNSNVFFGGCKSLWIASVFAALPLFSHSKWTNIAETNFSKSGTWLKILYAEDLCEIYNQCLNLCIFYFYFLATVGWTEKRPVSREPGFSER